MEAETPYTAMLARADEIEQETDRMSAGPEVVTRAIERAIRARRPRARYVVPFSSQLVVALFTRLLPTRLADWVMLRAMGVRREQPRSVPRLASGATP